MNQFETFKNKLNILSDEVDELHVLYEDDSYSSMSEQVPKIYEALKDMEQQLKKILELE